MPVTIRDVAAASGVSIGTVSRALNDYPDVSTVTRERVRAAAAELGYVPNQSAQFLSSKRLTSIALIISGFLEDKVFNDFDIMLTRGAFQFATEHDVPISLHVTNSREQAERSLDQLCFEHNVSGAIVFGLRTDDPYCESLSRSTTPCVTVDVPVPGERVGSVVLDDCAAASEMTDYLVSCGHRRIAVVHGSRTAVVSVERMEGIVRSLRSHGIELRDEDVIYTNFTHEEAFEKVGAYLDAHPEPRVTAFLCMSDLLALGTIQAIQRRGLSVPEDFSVTGYDGISLAGFVSPAITTVDQNVQTKGYEAARLLCDMISGRREACRVVLPHSLRKGGSVRKISR
ncbi:LacI family DNA-binding transcriptional regulator [Olsenella sp. DSM 107455]|uniref:LacI family DNA-binding transcriptional regulator n=1 Tax=Thermophilibacter gallinarum TaxID=2779357 RepID=A0ABR9QUV3_9ACTN|nr:LacI family DNA-binding transcriptional regulator [Thermophilibacter gallinarum]MBE5024853.1 LacI family DNA-binding transcriptional regulator [Thermophilibacter gallinarum]